MSINTMAFKQNRFVNLIKCINKCTFLRNSNTGVSAKTFEPNNSVIFQRIFVKFKMQIF
jgi:hypothetical protein